MEENLHDDDINNPNRIPLFLMQVFLILNFNVIFGGHFVEFIVNGGRVPCVSLGNSYLDNYNDVIGEITGICFQKVDEGKVNPVIDTDEFLKVDWPCAPTKPAVQHLYLELDYHSVPSQKWQLFADVMANLRTALLVQWASSVAEESTQIHSEEYKRREAFISQVGRHFLQTLFTGLDPFSSNFAVSFNEAVNKVSSGKDSIILELREKDSSSTEKLRVAQETIDKLVEEKSKVEDIKTRAMAHLSDKEREFATLEEIESKSKISMLEESEITMTASTRSVVQDKVSITSCSTGDLALFCLDERHDQYVVFTIGSTLHFLHSDCIEPLGLQANPSENRKSWVLAEITDKEYCQAKKSQNRFKVPIGTKFYRVKAKPWARDSSPRKGDLLPGTLSPRKGDSASASSSPRKGDPASGSS
ncbi:RB1CC1 [Mytilus edulis]|uniref:RB1CC1 n=1 Tax=Mytilus edulis TaxID=6550 RepID=A0A8S3RAI1_MYTED|nr:RB1CC1 [Mytilus edulis]